MAGSAWMVLLFVIACVFVVMKVASKKQEVAVKLVLILFIFVMLSGGYVFISNDINFTSAESLMDGSRLYWAWLSTLGGNTVSITNYAIQQDWGVGNATTQHP